MNGKTTTLTTSIRTLFGAGACCLAGVIGAVVPAAAGSAATTPTTKPKLVVLVPPKTEAEQCKEEGGTWVEGSNGIAGFCFKELPADNNCLSRMDTTDCTVLVVKPLNPK